MKIYQHPKLTDYIAFVTAIDIPEATAGIQRNFTLPEFRKNISERKNKMSEERPILMNDRAHVYYSTTDYDKFSLILINRPIDWAEVAKLTNAINEGRNHLHIYPIIVNKFFQITEGQHRHAAARQTKARLFYIIDDDFRMEDAISANNITSKWTSKQFIESYAKAELPEYIKIRDFHNKFPWVKISTLPKLCSSKGFGKLNLENGNYVADRMEFAHEVVNMISGFRQHIGEKQAEYNPFLQTVMNLAQNINYNHDRMMRKMEQRNSMFQRCATVPQYLAMLTEIYNYRVTPENRISLAEDFLKSRWQREGKEEN